MPRPRRQLPRYPQVANSPKELIRTSTLIGSGGLKKLQSSTVFIIGLGGVGSWAAEFLARSGIGRLILFDPDKIEITNINRQRQAYHNTVGLPKCEVLGNYIKFYNWQEMIPVELFMDDEKLLEYVNKYKPHAIIEAVDNVTAKAKMISIAKKHAWTYITSLGAASRLDPTLIRVADLSETSVCPLGKDLRKVLRRKHAFPLDEKFGIPAVYSLEKPWKSESDSLKDGSIVSVTASFGASLSSWTLKKLALP